MKVALVGGTGFVGNYLTRALLQAGHEPSLLVRPGSEACSPLYFAAPSVGTAVSHYVVQMWAEAGYKNE